jgi:hypothetical protein
VSILTFLQSGKFSGSLSFLKYFIGRRDLAGFFAAGATVEFATVIETPRNIEDHYF